MLNSNRATACVVVLLVMLASVQCRAQSAKKVTKTAPPISVFVTSRTRVDAWQWFAAPPKSNSYGYVESLIRLGIAQKTRHWDWRLEIAQPTIIDAPDNAVSPVAAQGQLGLGGTYYAANTNSYPVAAFFKQGFVRYHFAGRDRNLRVGRFEFLGGEETHPKNPTIAWLQTNRVAQRLIGNFGFANAQRSFDGIDGHIGGTAWDVTGAAARSDQGVFNMNGNPELNVDFQYLALTRAEANNHVLWRAFAIGYHDGRTGLTKTDNRAPAVRSTDHENIRMGTYGGDLVTEFPAAGGQLDLLFWGALQNGRWGVQDHSANAVALEGGYKWSGVSSTPWLRGGWFRSSGDSNSADDTHKTFFQLLPTPRGYARVPFYNLMNSTDEFVQVIDKPVKQLAVRSDLHWLQLTSAQDLWYQGGGAFDNKVFGYVGRPANGYNSLASVADISAAWQASKNMAVTFYYGYVKGKSVVAAIYPSGRDSQYGYVELLYHWGLNQRASVKQ